MKNLILILSLLMSSHVLASEFCEELLISAQRTASEGNHERRLAGRAYLNAKYLLENDRANEGNREKFEAKVKIVAAKAYLDTSFNLFTKVELQCEEQRDEAVQLREIVKVSLNQTTKLKELISNL